MGLSTNANVIIAAIFLFAAVATAQSGDPVVERGGKYCYAGTLPFGSSVLSFEFALVPYAPAIVLRPVFTLDGKILSLPEDGASFGCESDASSGTIALSVSFGTSSARRLSWIYESDVSCPLIVSDLTTVQGRYLGSDHVLDDLVQLNDEEFTGYQAEKCSEASCEPLIYDSGPIEFTGVALDKSACGSNGTTLCTMSIRFVTSGNCISTSTSHASVTELEVTVQPGDVLLSVYRPNALREALLTCHNSALSLEALGVGATWSVPSDNSADCGAILSDLKFLASGLGNSVAVDLGEGEVWQANYAPPLIYQAPPVDPSTGGGNEEPAEGNGGAHSNALAIRRPVKPHTYCNYHYGDGFCCAVYGYTNPNLVPVVAPAVKNSNFFVPYTLEGQPTTIPANTTVAISFSVEWACRKYERHFKTWTFHTQGSGHDIVFTEEAVASRQRDDCDFDGLLECGAFSGGEQSDAGATSTTDGNATTPTKESHSARAIRQRAARLELISKRKEATGVAYRT